MVEPIAEERYKIQFTASVELRDKLALVTGSTRGIGLATAVGLARMGAEVIVNGRGESAVAEALERVRKAMSFRRWSSFSTSPNYL